MIKIVINYIFKNIIITLTVIVVCMHTVCVAYFQVSFVVILSYYVHFIFVHVSETHMFMPTL